MTSFSKSEKLSLKSGIPAFAPGDAVRVHVKVREGEKERIQVFAGVVIARRGGGIARDVHRPQDLERHRGRADLPAALAGHRPDRSRAKGRRAARQALLPAGAQGQGRAHRREAGRREARRRSRARDGPATRSPLCSPSWVVCGSLRRLERSSRGRGFRLIAGVDEVGRGCLAGPGRRRRRHPARGMRPAGPRRLQAPRRGRARPRSPC